jgi:hypothetical protein
MDNVLACRGSFRYATHEQLLHALHEAREHLADLEEEARFLLRRGMNVLVDAVLPHTADRHVTAAVLGALAQSAVEGHVDVTIGNQLVDAFVCEGGLH